MKIKKICVVMVGYLKNYPPVLSFIQATKDLGIEVTVIAAGDNTNLESYPGYNFCGVKHKDIIGEYESNIPLISKMIRLFKIRQSLWLELNKAEYDDSLLIVVSEVTVKHLGMKLTEKNYVLYQLELIEEFQMLPHSDLFKLDSEKLGNCAKGVIVCEYNRAHITKTWWKLKNIPFIIKNKPYVPDFTENELPEKILNLMLQIKKIANGRKIILYQGIVTKQRPIEKFGLAFEKLSNEYLFVVMSNCEPEFPDKKPLNYLYIPFIEPPYHLAITSLADIGVMVYVSTNKSSYSNLNPVYCAPNKIWEYAKYGIPMISNDVPALETEFNRYNIGCCSSSFDEQDILHSIHQIENDYDSMSCNATKFYENYDIKKEIEILLEQL